MASSAARSLLLLGLALLAACGDGRLSLPPSPLPSPAVSPPADVPLDLDSARKLEHDGDVEQAVAVYSALAVAREGETRRQALWALARIYYGQGRSEEAVQVLSLLARSDPPLEEERRARLLLGMAELARGREAQAQEHLRWYIQADGPASAYARLRLADALSGQPEAAVQEIEAALGEGLPPSVEASARFDLARHQEAAGDGAAAGATLEGLAGSADTPYRQGEALWELAALGRRMGDLGLYQRSLYRLATGYPWHPRALESLSQPQLAPSPVLDALDRALVLFQHRYNEEAEEAFRAYLQGETGPEGQALAHHRLGILAERRSEPGVALKEYEAALAALEAQPFHDLYGQAAWDRGLLLEGLGRLEEAATAFISLADRAPGSDRAAEALFRAGLIRFRQSRFAEAQGLWARYLQTAPEASARAHLWLGRAAQALGDQSTALSHYQAAAEVAPSDYYGLRARALAGGGSPAEGRVQPQGPEPNWFRVEEWLRSWVGPEEATDQGLQGDLRWRRALELALAGLQDDAESEFAALISDAEGQPWLLYRLARALAEAGQTAAAARAASRLIVARPDAPRDLLALAYPSEYLDLAAPAAQENGFSPLLLLALVRQESFFDPDAVSSAQAMGLTQVIPSTAQEIARALGETAFLESDLLRPKVSLRFGAYYLGSQLALFQGDLAAALAAYNGGPGNALRWKEAAGDDPDLLVEMIDFSETRSFVQLVLENYAIYRYIYELEGSPSLPLAGALGG